MSPVNTAKENIIVFILNIKREFKLEMLTLNKEMTSFNIFLLEMSKTKDLVKRGKKKKNSNQLDEKFFPELIGGNWGKKRRYANEDTFKKKKQQILIVVACNLKKVSESRMTSYF